MAHQVDGFDLTFTSRTSWKAERRARGRTIDIVPVVWTKDRRQVGSEVYQGVSYQDREEMERRLADPSPFAVALAVAKDYAKHPHEFKEFRGVFDVVPTGERLSDHSIEARVLRRAQVPGA
jgi:hypothetical protein